MLKKHQMLILLGQLGKKVTCRCVVFNTSGKKYRELGLSKKLKTMSEDEQLNLLASDGMLIKRPMLITEKGVLLGFKEDQWAYFLKIRLVK